MISSTIFRAIFRNFYQRVKAGKLSIPIEHKVDSEGFEPVRKTLDFIANMIATAILAASVLICSSILILANMPPVVWGVSLFGVLGLIWGAFMGLRLAHPHLEASRPLIASSEDLLFLVRRNGPRIMVVTPPVW